MRQTEEERKKIAKDLQTRAMEQVVYIPFGQWNTPLAYRADQIDGDRAQHRSGRAVGHHEEVMRIDSRRRSRAGAPGAGAARGLVMTAYIVRRLFATLPVMAVVALFVFFLLRFAPGDPAAIIAGEDATAEAIAAVRAKLGLDRPMVEQFVVWILAACCRATWACRSSPTCRSRG